MLIGYVRVSSECDRQNTDMQKDALLSAGVDPRHIFEDKTSGANTKRPGLEKLIEFIQPKDILIVWKLDRLGRSLPHLVEIINMLKDKEVGFRSLTEGMDTMTPSGQLLFYVIGALAQFERDLTVERIRAGLIAARSRGRIGGRPRKITPEKLKGIVAAMNDGMHKAQICRVFDVKRSTLIDALTRENVQLDAQ